MMVLTIIMWMALVVTFIVMSLSMFKEISKKIKERNLSIKHTRFVAMIYAMLMVVTVVLFTLKINGTL